MTQHISELATELERSSGFVTSVTRTTGGIGDVLDRAECDARLVPTNEVVHEIRKPRK